MSASGIQPRVAVRVNPDFEVKGSGMRLRWRFASSSALTGNESWRSLSSSPGEDVDFHGLPYFRWVAEPER